MKAYSISYAKVTGETHYGSLPFSNFNRGFILFYFLSDRILHCHMYLKNMHNWKVREHLLYYVKYIQYAFETIVVLYNLL